MIAEHPIIGTEMPGQGWMQGCPHASLRGLLHSVLCLVQWNLPMMCQSDVVHGPLPHTRVDMTNVISLWHEVGVHQHHLPVGLQGSTKIIIVGDISSIILHGNWTKFPVGLLSANVIGWM